MAQFRKDKHQYLADGTTIFEVMMLADQYGNLVGAANPTGTAVDAFGRQRSSQPLTLFDSFHRYKDNGKVNTANSAGGTYQWVANTASIDMSVTTANNAYVYRETAKTFAYQPGKSLQILQTCVMNPSKTGLRQRFGYFGADNGFFLERSDDIYFVSRSKATGSVVDTKVPQSEWNMDKLDGLGPSQLTLDLDNPQILFTDIEWLGVGSVRMGFIINGQLIHCHSFHHANSNTAPKGAYMQTACLPVRAEIENTANTTSNSTLKVICTSVISEGGYELKGRKRTAYTPVTTQYQLTTAGTYYPVASLRLNANGYLDGIAILKGVDIVGVTNGFYHFKIVNGGTVTGGTWANTDSLSVCEYNINATSWSSNGTGIELKSGYFSSSTQSSTSINLTGELFDYQLERNTFANTAVPLTLLVSASVNTANVYVTIDWQETT